MENQENNLKIKNIPKTLPLLPVRDIVVFPNVVLPLIIGREKSIKAVENSINYGKFIFITTQKQPRIEDPEYKDIFQIGVVCEVLQITKLPDGTLKIFVEGLSRARILDFSFQPQKGYVEVNIELLQEKIEKNIKSLELEAFIRQTKELFEQYIKLSHRIPFDVAYSIIQTEDPLKLVDSICAHFGVKIRDRQRFLEILDLKERLFSLIELLTSEIEILNLEKKIQNRVRSQVEKSQKEFYLTEQMKAIQKELKQKDELAKEMDELRAKVNKAGMSKEAKEAALKEIDRLEKTMPFSPEATVIRTYLDWLLLLPWNKQTKDKLDIELAKKILEEDHYGLEKAKERIIEYIAVLKLVKKIKGPILCFVGPPGTGKTSLAKSIARALGRNFVRMSLGGIRDEAEIRGHRRTYIGALPGRIIQTIRKAKSKNPVFLLDEVDKIGIDWRGDPSSALLEVLDPEQNNSFMDHYLDVEFDLSNVLFICTANLLSTIPPGLQDRLEIIRFPGYTPQEKFHIAKKFLLKKQLKENGIKETQLEITDQAINSIIQDYTQEAGVRNLEREIAKIIRKSAKEIVSQTKPKKIVIDKNLKKFLGVPRFQKEKYSINDIGVSTALSWTEYGGELTTIEVSSIKGKGNLILTGHLGKVMEESAKAALTYVKSMVSRFNLKTDFFKDKDIHIHVPEGAIPKDGPSAGIAIATALASLVLNKPIRKDIAMTGEITLRGRILQIGGLKEKLIAAYRDKIKVVILPKGNEKDLEEIPKEILDSIKIISVTHMDDVLKFSLDVKDKYQFETLQTYQKYS